MDNRERWYQNYEALKAYILPDKHKVENRGCSRGGSTR